MNDSHFGYLVVTFRKGEALSTIRFSTLVVLSACFTVTTMQAQQAPTETLHRVDGLRARIDIIRDGNGVPHIRVRNEPDAIFGLGLSTRKTACGNSSILGDSAGAVFRRYSACGASGRQAVSNPRHHTIRIGNMGEVRSTTA
jgi:hypothetical protein